MKRTLLFFLIVVISTALFIGCSDDDDPVGPGNEGSFSISISGAVSKNITGFAWFWGGTVGGQSGFVLWLSSDDDMDMDNSGESLWFSREGTAQPGTGAQVISHYYDSYEEGWNPQHFFAWYSDDNLTFWSKSGQMNISTSSNNRFAGNFEFTASGYTSNDWENEVEVTISGQFDAVGGDFSGFVKTIE